MANVHVINFQVHVNRVLPIVQIIALKGEKGDPGEGTGEVNVIDTVKVNGTALPVVNKAVDVPVPTSLIISAILGAPTLPVGLVPETPSLLPADRSIRRFRTPHLRPAGSAPEILT